MSTVALELDQTLRQLDSDTAALLERAVRDALALAERRTTRHAETLDRFGYPVGYFEATAGSFANEPLESPTDLPPTTREPW